MALSVGNFARHMIFVSVMALAACDTQIVDPSLADSLSVQAAGVEFTSNFDDEMSLNGKVYTGNFMSQLQAAVVGQGSAANRTSRVDVSIDSLRISIVRGSRAVGSYTVVDTNTRAVLFGPQEFSVETPSAASNGGGGLLGLAIGAAVGGALQQNPRFFALEVEALGRLVGSRIKSQIFGTSF